MQNVKFDRIGLVGKYGSASITGFTLKLAQYLISLNKKVYIDCYESCDAYAALGCSYGKLTDWLNELDLVIVIGGDGTLISIARTVVGSNVPVVGVNQGNLGFMTDIPSTEVMQFIEEIVVKNHFTLEKRVLIHADVIRADKKVYSSTALNDVVISRGAIGNMIEFDIAIDNQFVLSQKSDGIIFSTPTGSTAYSLAAGGAILHPDAKVFSIIPICPQSLSNRPIVINDNSVIEFVLARDNATQIHFDGQESFNLELHDKVVLKKYPQVFNLIHPIGYNYYRTLRKKLDWAKRVS